jgi:hypothetical protein
VCHIREHESKAHRTIQGKDCRAIYHIWIYSKRKFVLCSLLIDLATHFISEPSLFVCHIRERESKAHGTIQGKDFRAKPRTSVRCVRQFQIIARNKSRQTQVLTPKVLCVSTEPKPAWELLRLLPSKSTDCHNINRVGLCVTSEAAS